MHFCKQNQHLWGKNPDRGRASLTISKYSFKGLWPNHFSGGRSDFDVKRKPIFSHYIEVQDMLYLEDMLSSFYYTSSHMTPWFVLYLINFCFFLYTFFSQFVSCQKIKRINPRAWDFTRKHGVGWGGVSKVFFIQLKSDLIRSLKYVFCKKYKCWICMKLSNQLSLLSISATVNIVIIRRFEQECDISCLTITNIWRENPRSWDAIFNHNMADSYHSLSFTALIPNLFSCLMISFGIN